MIYVNWRYCSYKFRIFWTQKPCHSGRSCGSYPEIVLGEILELKSHLGPRDPKFVPWIHELCLNFLHLSSFNNKILVDVLEVCLSKNAGNQEKLFLLVKNTPKTGSFLTKSSKLKLEKTEKFQNSRPNQLQNQTSLNFYENWWIFWKSESL